MSEREFVVWQKYAAGRMLPARREQVQLALLGLTIAKGAGLQFADGSPMSMDDFMVEPKREKKKKQASAEDANAISAMGGVRVHRLGQRKKASH